jgi:hypothetical protein
MGLEADQSNFQLVEDLAHQIRCPSNAEPTADAVSIAHWLTAAQGEHGVGAAYMPSQ